MIKKSYFLELEYLAGHMFKHIKDIDNVKVVVPSGMPSKAYKLHTEPELDFVGTNPQSDIEKLKKAYPDYDVFYLNVNSGFEISDRPHTVGAFVCVPKNNKSYVANRQEYVGFVQETLETYYNNEAHWDILVMDSRCEEFENLRGVDKYYDYVVTEYALAKTGNGFSKKDEDWFNTCMTKYGISKQEIDMAKSIIQSHDETEHEMYVIKNNLPVPLGMDDTGHKVVADVKDVGNLLITGQTGCGKSALLKAIIKSIHIDTYPQNVNFKTVLIDTKDFDFRGYKSSKTMAPVITNPDAAVDYLKMLQPGQNNIVIIIDELSDLIATSADIVETLIKLAKTPKVHIIAATRIPDILPPEFMAVFNSRVSFNGGMVADAVYLSDAPQQQIHIKTKG